MTGPAISTSLAHLQAREAQLLRSLQETRELMRIAASGTAPLLPLPYGHGSSEDALQVIEQATEFWSDDQEMRVEFLLRAALLAPEARRDLFIVLKCWLRMLSERQSRLTRRLSRPGGDAPAHIARLHARPVISRLIEIRREIKAVQSLAMGLRESHPKRPDQGDRT